MEKSKEYEKILGLLERNQMIDIDIAKKEIPEISARDLREIMKILTGYNLARKIPLAHDTFEKTDEYTKGKGMKILKSYFHIQDEEKTEEPVMPRYPPQEPKRLSKSRTARQQNKITYGLPDNEHSRSWCDAAYEVLKTENRPLGPTELTAKILSSSFVKSRSRNPVNTVYTCIFQDMKAKGARSRFMKFGKKIGLVEWADKYLDGSMQSELQTNTQVQFWKRFKFKEIPERELLTLIRDQIQEIRSFLNEESASKPSSEKLCFWVWFCYQFGLYWEGAFVFRRIDALNVSPPLYQTVKKIGMICENRRE